MKKTLSRLSTFFLWIIIPFTGFAQSGTALTISEVMFNPSDNDGEFIEIYNTSATETINLTGFKIRYYTSSSDGLTAFIVGMELKPGKFAVIIENDYDYTNGSYKNLIPPDALVIKISDASFGTSGMANTTSRDVSILNAAGEVVDTYTYSADNSTGISDEKIVLNKDNSTNNWKNGLLSNGTPGRINSVSIKKNDLTIKGIVSKPLYPALNEEINIGAKVVNLGTSTTGSFSVRYYFKNGNALSLITETSAASLRNGDSLTVYSTTKIKLNETKTILCKINFASDEDTLNNSFTGDIIPGVRQGSILITEVMYDPLTREPEWIEFVNASSETVNLRNWAISDLLTTPTKVILTNKDEFLQPGEYAIATPDTQAFAFNPPKKFFQTKFGILGNTSDGVLIYDFRNGVIDSLFYKGSWGGGNGVSLERISLSKATNDSTNWTGSLSAVGATPGIKNASSTAKSYKRGDLVINEIFYEPETGNAEFFELYNTTSDTVQVGGMSLNVGSSSKIKLSTSSLKIPPKEFCVFATSASIYTQFPTLNKNLSKVVSGLTLSNDGTTLVVKDLLNITLDSVSYSPTWHNRNFLETRNKSLERINPALSSNDKTNWTSSVASAGSTPGKQNSVYTQSLSSESKVTISPNPFSPDNDGFEDFAIINFNLPYKLSQVQIKVFDSQGRLVRTLLENRPAASSNSVIFDGRDDDGNSLRIGIYILLIEISSDSNGNVETIKEPIVVARKLN